MSENNYDDESEYQKSLKQTFLREQIILKGYDPSSFLSYCNSLKEGGADVDLWSFHELKTIVDKFQQTYQAEQEEAQQQDYIDKPQQDSPPQNQQEEYLPQNQQEEYPPQNPIQPDTQFNYTPNDNFAQQEFNYNPTPYSNNKFDAPIDNQQVSDPWSNFTQPQQVHNIHNKQPDYDFFNIQSDISLKKKDDGFGDFFSLPPNQIPNLPQQQQEFQFVLNDNDFDLLSMTGPKTNAKPIGGLNQIQIPKPGTQSQLPITSPQIPKVIPMVVPMVIPQTKNQIPKVIPQVIPYTQNQIPKVIPQVQNQIPNVIPQAQKITPPISNQTSIQQNQVQSIKQQLNAAQDNFNLNQLQQINPSKDFLKIAIDTNKVNGSQIYQKQVMCLKLPLTRLGQTNNIHIQILEHKIVKGSLLSSDQCFYVVQCLPFKWEVQRKFEDFEFLQNNIKKLFPGVIVPPLPKTPSLTSATNPQIINTRKNYLEHFLNFSIGCPEIRNSVCFENFLAIKDEKQWKQTVKDQERWKKPQSFDDVRNIEGVIELHMDTDQKQYFSNVGVYLDNLDIAHDKLSKLNKQLLTEYSQVANTMYEIGKVYESMQINTKLLNQGGKQNYQYPKLEETFTILNNMFMQDGDCISRHVKHLENYLEKFQLFQHGVVWETKQSLKFRSQFQQEFKRKVGINGFPHPPPPSSRWDATRRAPPPHSHPSPLTAPPPLPLTLTRFFVINRRDFYNKYELIKSIKNNFS